MQADDFGAFRFLFKMAGHRVLHHFAQVVPIFALRKDVVAERARPETAFIGFAHVKNNLAQVESLAGKINFGKGERTWEPV